MVDSTCLIALEWVGHLDLLPKLFESVHAPLEVQREFGGSIGWLEVEKLSEEAASLVPTLGLDLGESEAIALAIERRSRIILDDRKAREVALKQGLKVIGTIGLLVRAKREKIIPWVKPLLDELDKRGFRMTPSLKAEALQLAGEAIRATPLPRSEA